VVSPETARRALAALAAGDVLDPAGAADPVDTNDSTRTNDPAAVVATAAAAMGSLADAAAFVDAGGERLLRTAVATADRRGRTDLARRGQRVLATLARFRSVVGPRDAREPYERKSDTRESDAVAVDGARRNTGQSAPAADVHFRRATESVKPAEGEEADR
jgi:hypothetical protein